MVTTSKTEVETFYWGGGGNSLVSTSPVVVLCVSLVVEGNFVWFFLKFFLLFLIAWVVFPLSVKLDDCF